MFRIMGIGEGVANPSSVWMSAGIFKSVFFLSGGGIDFYILFISVVFIGGIQSLSGYVQKT